jgi:hypothetical protein
MFADPISITVNGVAKVLPRVDHNAYSSEYRLRSTLDEITLKIRNTSYTDKKRGVLVERHNLEFIQTIFPVSPATLSTVRKTYVVVENQQGDTLADCVLHAAAACYWLIMSSEANLNKLMNSES